MAAPALGKRQRLASSQEDADADAPRVLPVKRRRTRTTTPAIYRDDDGPSIVRNVRSKRTVRNIPPTTVTKEPEPNEVTHAVTGENEPPVEFKTPSTTRFRDALSSTGLETPKTRVRVAGRPLTPRTPRTLATPPSRQPSVYATARDLFSQSSTHRKVVGRDSERADLRSLISEAVNAKTGGCIYVSGPPGTGKSALMDEMFTEFKSNAPLKAASINCVGIHSAKEVYGKLVEEFCAGWSSSKVSQKDHLRSLFVPKMNLGSCVYLVLLDEIDNLVDAECEVLYNLFEWALCECSRLILIGIANALDLTDRFLPRLKARNLKPRLLPFTPYTATQIDSIITDMLRSTLAAGSSAADGFVPFLHPAAIRLTSKKVASQSGDLRKAFSLVRRVIDQVERETLAKSASPGKIATKQPLSEISNFSSPFPLTPPSSSPFKLESNAEESSPGLACLTPETAPRATVAHIARLASSIFNNGTTSRLAGLNLQQKAVLCSLLAAENKKHTRDLFTTPTKSANKAPAVRDLYIKYAQLCTRDGGLLQPLKSTEFRDVVASLETLGLVHESSGRTTSFLTPTKTPSRGIRSADDRQIVSTVSEKELIDSLKGPGAELLQRLLHE